MTCRLSLRNAASLPVSRAASLLLAVSAVFMCGTRAEAQGKGVWSQTQGPTGGKINTLTINSQDSGLIYAGTDGGVYASEDGGGTWRYSGNGLPAGQEVRALVINPAAANILYAGTYAGVYQSKDGARTWVRADRGLTRRLVLSLAIDPWTTSTLYAGTDGQVFKSTDGGAQWNASGAGLPVTNIWSLVADPLAANALYAGTDSGVFKSLDAGLNWERASDGIPEEPRIQALAVDPHNPGALYSATEAGIYQSLDAAETWHDRSDGIGRSVVHALAIDPNDTNVLYAAVGTQGVWRSTNSGKTWEPTTGNVNELVLTLGINLAESGTIYAGTGRGVYYSSNAGQHWEPRNRGLINANVLLLVPAPNRPGCLYAVTGLDVQRTTDDGQTWSSINKGLVHPNVLALAVDPVFPDTVYAGTWYGEVYCSADSGSTWQLSNPCLVRDAQISALAIERSGKSRLDRAAAVLYASTNGSGVFRSMDGGAHWKAINDGLDELHVQMLTLAPTGQAALYAGTSRGVYRLDLSGISRTGAAIWQPISLGEEPDEVTSIVVDQRVPDVVYVVTATGGMYGSTDSGLHWKATDRGMLPTNIRIRALALSSSPGQPCVLYVATDGGVFRSGNGGTSWSGMNDGLPARANVLALSIDARRSSLYASISNSGVYRSVDGPPGLLSQFTVTRAIPGVAVLAIVLVLAGRWSLLASRRAQDQLLERNWPQWREDIRHILQAQNEVRVDTLTSLPSKLRSRALRLYMQEHGDDNLMLRLPGSSFGQAAQTRVRRPVLAPADSLQVWDFIRNWRAAQQRLHTAAAFEPVASQIANQLCKLLGFTLVHSRSYKRLHGYVIKAPGLRLKLPPTFPIIFLQKQDLTEQDVDDLRDLIGILNLSSFLAVLVVPDEEATSGGSREVKTQLKQLTSHMADDFIVIGFDDLYRIFLAKEPERRFVGILLQQVDLAVVSPYVTSGPVPENMFFGRDYELKTITRMIEDRSFAITGGRKIGKTSILAKLHRLFMDSTGHFSLYLDCQAVQTYRDFHDAIEAMWRLPPSDGSPESFMRLMAKVKQEHEGQSIVVLLDEVDALLAYDTANQERLFKRCRALSQEGQCRFVFCGERTLHRRLHDPTSAFFNFCNVIQLSYLKPRDTGRIILEPMQEMGIGFEDAGRSVQAVIDLSACHPNIVQYICQELVATINARGDRRITSHDVEAIGDSMRFREYLVEVMWGNATPLQRLITLLMLEGPGLTFEQIEKGLRQQRVEVPASAIEEALDRLLLCSVITREEQEYCLTAPTFAPAVTSVHDLASLVARMREQVSKEMRTA